MNKEILSKKVEQKLITLVVIIMKKYRSLNQDLCIITRYGNRSIRKISQVRVNVDKY